MSNKVSADAIYAAAIQIQSDCRSRPWSECIEQALRAVATVERQLVEARGSEAESAASAESAAWDKMADKLLTLLAEAC